MPITIFAEHGTSCPYCLKGIKKGAKISKDFELDAWMHARCWFKRNNPKWGRGTQYVKDVPPAS